MKKGSSSCYQNMGSFPSPGAPYYRERGLRNQKGWSSERVSKPETSISRRHSMAGLTPFSGGRTMPSKWDEAERWICSPVSAYAESRSSHHHHNGQLQRRPKSISGPIVPPGVAAFYSSYSPLHQGLVVRNLVVASPFSTGVLAPVAVSVHHYDAHDDATVYAYDHMNNATVPNDNAVVLSSMLSTSPMCSQLPCHQSSPVFQDEKHDGTMNEENVTCHSSRCDKGTQMSPAETENDVHSSPKSCASSVVDQQECHSPKLEVRDVQVDSQATIIRWSKRHATKLTKKDSIHSHSKDSREISAEAQTSWDTHDSNMDTSKIQREEAKIIAWENLQKAKAETAIRKLEMKLEKKRSSSMDKILNKLRRAHLKAENMRSSIPVRQGNQVSKCRIFSLSKYVQIWSPSSCFSSHDQ